MFQIEDERHAEAQGQFGSLAAALAELERRAALPWDQPPNVAPCQSWRTCGRSYEIVEYDDWSAPMRELSRTAYLEVSARGARWLRREE